VRTGLAAAASLVLLVAGGCGGSPDDPDAASRAESLWAARVAYVGDNARVTSLVDQTLAGASGYTVELHTAAPPYALTIALEDLDEPFDDTDFSSQATLLLGLVANLDEVSVTAGQDGYSLSAAAASRDLGHDVKQLGQDQSSLVRYLERTSD